MRYLLPFFCFFLISCSQSTSYDPSKESWIDLFNGKDLSGWEIKIRGHELNDNFNQTFGVDSGRLVVNYDNYEAFDETFGHIFYQTPYSYYKVRAEYRFVGEQAPGGPGWATRNNGLMLHSQSAASMGLDQDFPISIEVQLLGGLGKGPRTTANLCTPGTHVFMNDSLFTPHCTSSTSKTYEGDQWVTVEIEVLGDSMFTHYVEGEKVLSYTHPQIGGGVVGGFDEKLKEDGKLLKEGYIALQGESHPTEFRKIELLDLEGCLDPKAKNYKSYFVKGNKAKCVY